MQKQLATLPKQALLKRIESGNAAARKAREKSAHVVDEVVQSAVAGVTAFGVAYADAHFDKEGDGVKLGPIPMPLAAGAVLLGLGLTGMGGEASKYLMAAGNGAFMAWAAGQGTRAGLKR